MVCFCTGCGSSYGVTRTRFPIAWDCFIFNRRTILLHAAMRKTITLLFFCICTLSFSQKDSIDPEIRRFQVMRDSMYKAGLARESTFRVQMDEILLKTRRSIEDAKQKEIEEATNQVMAQQEKSQGAKRKTMMLALAGFSLAAAVTGLVIRQKRRSSRS
jgi:hypothetical protein